MQEKITLGKGNSFKRVLSPDLFASVETRQRRCQRKYYLWVPFMHSDACARKGFEAEVLELMGSSEVPVGEREEFPPPV